MEYNSKREELIIPEYGRHVQNMIRFARDVEKPEDRQAYIEQIVKLMMQMHPQNKNMEDYRDKMWMHVFRIAEYKLDVKTPSGERPTADAVRKRPERVSYPAKGAKYKHYGHNVLALIEKAKSMPKGLKRDGFVQVIGSYMKLAYKTWNKEHYVSDDIIIEDLVKLSNGELIVVEDASLDNLTKNNPNRKSISNQSNTGNNNKRSSSGNGRDNRSSGGKNNGGGGSSGRTMRRTQSGSGGSGGGSRRRK